MAWWNFPIGWVLLGTCLIASAEQVSGPPRVGVMLVQPVDHPFAKAFAEGLRDLGYVEGKNLHVEYRSVEGNVERMPAVVAEFIRMKVNVIVAGGGSVGPRTARQATRTIPIIFPVAADPIGSGLVESLARPGGNVTGVALFNDEMNAKRLQLLRELLPTVKRVALLGDPAMVGYADGVKATQEAARTLGIQIRIFGPRGPEEFQASFETAKKEGAEALVALPSSTFARHAKRLVELAAQNGLVAVWEHRMYPDAGGLLSYGHDIADMYRLTARYVDKILKGAMPGELAVEQGTKLDLVINRKAAKALGITIPPTLLVRADQVLD